MWEPVKAAIALAFGETGIHGLQRRYLIIIA
jgi:hypothetical protein